MVCLNAPFGGEHSLVEGHEVLRCALSTDAEDVHQLGKSFCQHAGVFAD